MKVFPETITKACQWCGAEITLERRGTGELFRGRPSYWWTTTHDCQERRDVAAKLDKTTAALTQVLKGGRP